VVVVYFRVPSSYLTWENF